MELKDLLNLAENQRLQQIEQQRSQLQSMVESPDLLPEVRAAYDVALSRLDETLRSQAQSEPLQNGYATYGLEGSTGLEQIQPLETILPTEQLSPLREGLEARILAAKDFFDKYGAHTPEAQEFVEKTGGAIALASTIEITPTEPAATEESLDLSQPPSAETGETEKTNVLIQVRQKTIQMGKQGRIIPLSKKHTRDQRDYGKERLAALQYIVDHQNQGELSPYEIWSGISSEQFNQRAFTQVKVWLESLTYRRQRLILSNKKRGASSRYTVSPCLLLELSFVGEPAIGAHEIATERFSAGDAYIAVRHLEQFNPILKERGCPTIEKELVQSLSVAKPDYSHIKGNETAIWASRQAALGRAEKLLGDDDEFFAFIDQVSESASEYQFIKYLFDLEAEHRELLRQLVGAKVEREVISTGQIRFWAVSAHDKDKVIAFSDVTERAPTQISEMVEPEPRSAGDSGTETAAGEITTLVEGVAIQIPHTPEVEPKEESIVERIGIPKRFSKAEKEKINQLRLKAEAIASVFINSGLDSQARYKRTEIQSVLHSFTTKVVREALEAGIISRENRRPSLNLQETIRVLLYANGKTQATYQTRKYKRTVEKIINQAINTAAEAYRLTNPEE